MQTLRDGQKNIGNIDEFKSVLSQCTSEDLLRLGKEGDPHSGRALLHVICNQGFIRNADAVLDHAK